METRSRQKSVIVTDNNEFYRRVLGDFYRDMGLDVRTASHGMEALEQLQQRRPDLLVLDLIMPCIDGAQLCGWVKRQVEYKDLPVIIFSGILSDEIDDVESIGADAYVAKMPMDRIDTSLREASRALLDGTATIKPLMYGFEKMFRREVVLELLQDRRARQEILDSLTEGIAELTADRRLLETNGAFDEIAGAGGHDLLSRSLDDVFPDARGDMKALFAGLRKDGILVSTTTFSHLGRQIRAKLHKVAKRSGAGVEGVGRAIQAARASTDKVHLKESREPIAYTLLIEDVSEKVQADKERERLKSRLAQSEKMSALGVFVAGAAHELNNPLTSIMGYAQLLAKRAGTGEAQRELARITDGAERCREIIDQLMVFARTLRPEKKVIDLNRLMSQAMSNNAPQFAEHHVDAELALGDGDMSALVEAVQIEQVFDHIADNAVRAMSRSEGRKRLRVSTRRAAGRIRIEFEDTGPGIPADRMSRIFDPFFTTEAAGHGRGLGLSVAYGIVSAHAGQISVRNRPEGGAAICVDLPAADQDKRASAGDGPRRVLVVDDEPVVVELLAEIFRGNRHEVDTASGGIEALDRLQKSDYDLVILDLRMPDMSGQQLYQELAREHPRFLPRLLFITGDTVMPEVDGFLERVGAPCLLKPFSIDMVIEKAEAILYPNRPA